MKIAIDTSAYSAMGRGDKSVLSVIETATTLGICAVVLGELYTGFRSGSHEPVNRGLLKRFLDKPSVKVLPVTGETALHYAEIDAYLRRKGRPIPRNDIWIAASAMEHGMQLLTKDSHFAEIPLLVSRP
ncbi:MAG: type II toxin-antitoxin system VapC family toxin [Candidatus Solibacter usitatus]|nr:type II toxin-antitoxin system VapC family toxin [Candidatus Solibacter usitatus]